MRPAELPTLQCSTRRHLQNLEAEVVISQLRRTPWPHAQHPHHQPTLRRRRASLRINPTTTHNNAQRLTASCRTMRPRAPPGQDSNPIQSQQTTRTTSSYYHQCQQQASKNTELRGGHQVPWPQIDVRRSAYYRSRPSNLYSLAKTQRTTRRTHQRPISTTPTTTPLQRYSHSDSLIRVRCLDHDKSTLNQTPAHATTDAAHDRGYHSTPHLRQHNLS